MKLALYSLAGSAMVLIGLIAAFVLAGSKTMSLVELAKFPFPAAAQHRVIAREGGIPELRILLASDTEPDVRTGATVALGLIVFWMLIGVFAATRMTETHCRNVWSPAGVRAATCSTGCPTPTSGCFST